MTDKTLTPLADVFGFTAQDLRLNREGKIAPAQRRRLWLRFWGTVIGGWLLMLAPVLLAWGLILWATDAALNEVLLDQRSLLAYVIALVLAGIYIGANWRLLLLSVDLMRGRVGTIETPAQVWGRYLILKKYRFVLEQDTHDLIQTGLTYRAYVLPQSQTLLSMEFAE